MRRRPIQLDFGEEFAATLPYPDPGACPTEEFTLSIPASAEPRLLNCQVFDPSTADQAHAAQEQLRVDLSTGSVLLIAFRSIPAASRLPAARG